MTCAPLDLTPYRYPGGTTLRCCTDVGCYPLFYLDAEDACLCAACATTQASESDAAPIVAADVHWEGEPIECDECGTEIASAYGPVES